MDSNDNKEQTTPEEQEKVEAVDTEKKPDASGGKIEANPVELSPVKASQKANQKPDEDLNLKMILDIPVDMQVELGNTELTIREVLKLGIGSIVELDRTIGSAADIIVNGKLVGQGDVVVVDENFGIRITKLVGPEERLESL